MILVYSRKPTYIDYFCRAAARLRTLVGIDPNVSSLGFLMNRVRTDTDYVYPLIEVDLPLGYGRKLYPLARRRVAAMRERAEALAGEKTSAVVFTLPHYWRSLSDFSDVQTVYFATDDYRDYGWGDDFLMSCERQMVSQADHVLCISRALRERFISDIGADPAACYVCSNATFRASLPPEPLERPAELPEDLKGLKRPVAGVIGRLETERTDFDLICKTANACPWLSWAFVGPASPEDRERVKTLITNEGTGVVFTGAKPYEELIEYTRAFDVGIIPYKNTRQHKYGSAVRLYVYLAATRPIVVTSSVDEFQDFREVLHFADTAEEMAEVLARLRRSEFADGLASRRLELAGENTWDARGKLLVDIIEGKRAPEE